MLTTQLILALLMIVATSVLHVTVIFKTSDLISACAPKLKQRLRDSQVAITIIAIGVLSITLLHTLEATLWATLYLYLGEFSDFSSALYFSIVTSSTLGYGDITLTENWRLLGSFESMGGLILFGLSTAFMLTLMAHLFDARKKSDS